MEPKSSMYLRVNAWLTRLAVIYAAESLGDVCA